MANREEPIHHLEERTSKCEVETQRVLCGDFSKLFYGLDTVPISDEDGKKLDAIQKRIEEM
eukprot:2056338-Heterocapsa_arctica.AAC.1